jgi:chorismate-pyruvate lyase
MPDLDDLVSIFYTDPMELGAFQAVEAEDLPDNYRTLLAHDDHMTVTVESFHGSPVDVEVLQSQLNLRSYSRKILLRRHSDGQVVQFGIVRLDFQYLSEEVQQEILARQTPLGRILIQHNVLRNVELVGLWKIRAGRELAAFLGVPQEMTVYGRTALIHCNGEPAVELLEIVTA